MLNNREMRSRVRFLTEGEFRERQEIDTEIVDQGAGRIGLLLDVPVKIGTTLRILDGGSEGYQAVTKYCKPLEGGRRYLIGLLR